MINLVKIQLFESSYCSKTIFLCIAVTSERCSFSHHECSSVSCSAGTPHCVLGTCTCTTNTGKGNFCLKSDSLSLKYF